MIEEDPNDRYDKQRCRVCGHNWEPFRDEHGRIFAGHPYGQTCSRYKPAEEKPPSYVHAQFAEFDAAAIIAHANGSQS